MKDSLTVVLLGMLLFAGTTDAEDVMRFRGHNSQGAYTESGLIKVWPENGLTPIWINSNLGAGWSSIIKVNDHLYLNCEDSSDSKKESIVCLDLAGVKIWQTQTGDAWSRSYPAARSTPTYVAGVKSIQDALETVDMLVVLTGNGEVYCLNAKEGQLLWKNDVASTYGGKPGSWGYAESLVVKDGMVFAALCGEKASVVALRLSDGSVVWETPSIGDKCGYVSPILYGDQLIQHTATYLFSINTQDGSILWKHNYANDSSGKPRGINCNTTLLKDNKLFVTAGYNQGGAMYEILSENKGVNLLWKTADLDPHHGGAVELDGRIYGSNWINNGMGNWLCIDWNTGKTIYETKWDELGKGSIITADGMLYIYEEKRGTLGLVKPGDHLDVVSQFRIDFGSKEHWSHPTISDGILYVRHGNALAAFDLRIPKSLSNK